jgi:hypothetical protein
LVLSAFLESSDMIAFPTVISLRFESDGKPVGYVMVQTESLETAKSVASNWARQHQKFEFDLVVEHQGVTQPPLKHVEEFNGYRIWELPF